MGKKKENKMGNVDTGYDADCHPPVVDIRTDSSSGDKCGAPGIS